MTTDNASQEAGQPTVAKRLRQAREVAGLSVAEVAAKQHLRPAVISAIEAGDYRTIDSELFLKGYVRAYASHVGIDPDSVVRQLDKELEPLREEQKARVEASPLVTIERRKRRKRQIARVVSVLILLAVLFYVGSLYLASQEATTESVAADEPLVSDGSNQASATENDDSLVDDADSMDSETASPGPLNEPVTVSQGDDDRGGSTPEANTDVPETTAINAESGGEEAYPETDAGAASEQAVAEQDSMLADGAGPSTTDSQAPANEPTELADNEGRLVVEFVDDCWIEVQDRAGRTLVAELRRAGETLDVTGDSPLRVVLGAASAVSAVSYSGEPVSLSDRQTRNDRLVLNLSD